METALRTAEHLSHQPIEFVKLLPAVVSDFHLSNFVNRSATTPENREYTGLLRFEYH